MILPERAEYSLTDSAFSPFQTLAEELSKAPKLVIAPALADTLWLNI